MRAINLKRDLPAADQSNRRGAPCARFVIAPRVANNLYPPAIGSSGRGECGLPQAPLSGKAHPLPPKIGVWTRCCEARHRGCRGPTRLQTTIQLHVHAGKELIFWSE